MSRGFGGDGERYDLVVVGAGVVGLSLAYHASRRGMRVRVLERGAAARGASVRNFGMIWPVGRPAGPSLERALRARRHWFELAGSAGFWLNPCGSLHLALTEPERAVLEEFVAAESGTRSRGEPRAGSRPVSGLSTGLGLLSPAEARRVCPSVRADRVVCAMFSPTECAVDPREATAKLGGWLGTRPGVEVSFSTAVVEAGSGFVRTAAGEEISADRVIIAGGADFETLFPEELASLPIVKCQLQMLRSTPHASPRLGVHVAGGLSLLHYPAFRRCPSIGLVAAHYERVEPRYDREGVHVLVSENAAGELSVGDSHRDGNEPSPFRDESVDGLILGYFRRMLDVPGFEIAERWFGVYARRTDGGSFVHERVRPGVEVLTAIGGLGMTISPAVAEEVIEAGGEGETVDPWDVADAFRAGGGSAAPGGRFVASASPAGVGSA